MSPVRPGEKEEEFFLRQEAEKLKARAEQLRRQTDDAERKRLKELHWMRCPKCGMEMTEITYRNVAIDECFTCGGIYLDAGELEQVAASDQKGGLFSGLTRIFRGEETDLK
jgi:hypothetical protein